MGSMLPYIAAPWILWGYHIYIYPFWGGPMEAMRPKKKTSTAGGIAALGWDASAWQPQILASWATCDAWGPSARENWEKLAIHRILPWTITIFNGKIHYKWPFLIELDDGKISTGKPDQFDGKNM